MKYIILTALTAFIAFSCKSDNPIANLEEIPSTTKTAKDPLVINTMKQLQGTWNSRDDKNTAITFKDNTRQESRDGKALGKMRYFEISDQCNNDAATSVKKVRVKAKFISMLYIDMCYYIKKITKKELILSYVGRHKDLRYIKDRTIINQ